MLAKLYRTSYRPGVENQGLIAHEEDSAHICPSVTITLISLWVISKIVPCPPSMMVVIPNQRHICYSHDEGDDDTELLQMTYLANIPLIGHQ